MRSAPMADTDTPRALLIDLEATNVFNNLAPQSPWATLYTQNRLLTAFRQPPIRLQAGFRYQF